MERKIKGTLIPIGGAEDRDHKKDILCRIVTETGKQKPQICLVTIATDDPKGTLRDYRTAFRKLAGSKVTHLHFESHTEADSKKNIKMIEDCDAVLLSGGDQLRLSSLLGGTTVLKKMKERYYSEAGFVIAGTSAGASAMSDTMIISGSSSLAMIKGELELTNGLDMLDSVFIDTHCTERGRVGRLIHTVTCNPGVLGIGLGEDTAVVIYKGDELEVVGSGLVMIVDGNGITYTDLIEVENGKPVSVEGIKVHILGPEKRFVISERKMKVRHKSAGK